MKESFTQFDKGLAFGPPADALLDGYLRRARGMHALSRGSFRSRPGASLIRALNAHSIFYFADIYHYGVGTSFYRTATSIKTGLSGARLSFAKVPPTAGLADYLFIAGGGDLFKVDSTGSVTPWGFAAPASNPAASAAAGGSLTDATWTYQITYYNSVTGHRSNGNGTSVSATTSGANNSITLSSLPDGSTIDTQITHVEIWRTVANGTALFYLTRIATGIASYTDDGSTTLSSTELPTDNAPPDDAYFDCLGPHNASVFWLSANVGERGRIYYSPIGRTESVSGFINVSSDDAPLWKLFRFQGQLGVIGEAGIYLIGGTLPYVPREVSGCLGTTLPFTVAVIPEVGVIYEAPDGIRLFNGASSILITPGAVERIFRGESIADLTSFTGTIAAYARNEYIISDTVQTLAYSITDKRWRDLGIGLTAIYYNTESDVLAATIASEILSLEVEGETDDNGTAITLSLEPGHITFPDDRERLLQHVTFDINCASQQITATLIHDSSETVLGTLQTTTRTRITLSIGISALEFGITLTASLTAPIELHRIDFYFNDPDAEATT